MIQVKVADRRRRKQKTKAKNTKKNLLKVKTAYFQSKKIMEEILC
jgi:hypothetical protein